MLFANVRSLVNEVVTSLDAWISTSKYINFKYNELMTIDSGEIFIRSQKDGDPD
jgi:hypothetical protein